MCVRFQVVNSRHATRFAFVPCGKCEECRNAQKIVGLFVSLLKWNQNFVKAGKLVSLR